jgi:hypothetical protein
VGSEACAAHGNRALAVSDNADVRHRSSIRPGAARPLLGMPQNFIALDTDRAICSTRTRSLYHWSLLGERATDGHGDHSSSTGDLAGHEHPVPLICAALHGLSKCRGSRLDGSLATQIWLAAGGRGGRFSG